MNTGRKKFDEEAASWDSNPGRVKVAADIARAIIDQVTLSREMDVLDFGCGTGLVSLALLPFVRSVTGVDSAQGMLDVLRRKIADQHLKNVDVRFLDLEKGDVLAGCFHLVVSSMTLHHVKTIGPLLKQFHQVLRPTGQVCIADLDSDDGRFHQDPEGVFHFGFDRQAMRQMLLDAAFQDIRIVDAARVEKPVASDRMHLFTVFLATGRK